MKTANTASTRTATSSLTTTSTAMTANCPTASPRRLSHGQKSRNYRSGLKISNGSDTLGQETRK